MEEKSNLITRLITWILILSFFSGYIVFSNDAKAFASRTQIKIDSNNDFTTQGWPGNGTEGDPWIIDGYEIDGNRAGYSVYIGNTTEYFIVRNCYLKNSEEDSYPFMGCGIIVNNAWNGIIDNNKIINNHYSGINVIDCEKIKIYNNTISGSEMGINMYMSNNNTISYNNFSFNLYSDIKMDTTYYNEFYNNTLDTGFYIFRDLMTWNTQVIDSSNLVNGKPVYYWKNQIEGTLPADAGQIILGNCTNVIIENQNISNRRQDVIAIGHSSNVTIRHNKLNNISGVNIFLYCSNDNIVTNNTITGNKSICGIILFFSNRNQIIYNNISYNNVGISFFESCAYNVIKKNNITCNYIYGIDNGLSEKNQIYYNNFIGNGNHTNDYEYDNFWNATYPAGGNYWDNYTGTDTNNDKIGDSPYYTQSGGIDNYPLMEPYFGQYPEPLEPEKKVLLNNWAIIIFIMIGTLVVVLLLFLKLRKST